MLYSAAWGIPFAFPETPRCHNLALGATSWKTPATDFSFSPPFHCSTESRVFLSISWGGNIHKHIPGPGRDSVFSFTDTKTGIRSQSEVKSFDKFCHVRHMLEFSPRLSRSLLFSTHPAFPSFRAPFPEDCCLSGFWAFWAIFQACPVAPAAVVISLFQNCCSCSSCCSCCCWPGSPLFSSLLSNASWSASRLQLEEPLFAQMCLWLFSYGI